MPDGPGEDRGAQEPGQFLAERLRARSEEIEGRVLVKLQEIYELSPETRLELIAGAQLSIRDVLTYSLIAFEEGEDWSEPMPQSFADTARHAARQGTPLEDLLRGYSAGNTIISEAVVQEVQGLADPEALLSGIEVQNRIADALISGLSAAYASEVARLDTSPTFRIEQRVEQLLTDESIADAEIDYCLDAWHTGAIISGDDAAYAARFITGRIGCELLLVQRAPEVHWAWWGGAERVPFVQLETAAGELGRSFFVAVGEPRQGVNGFRLSHREAQLAAAVMVRRSERLTRCTDVMLPGALMQEPALADLYVNAYLGPMKAHKNWGALRETLSAYFKAERNLASAAAALRVDRHTIRRRLRKIEEILERPLGTMLAELEVALRLDDLTAATQTRGVR